jgi:hypothetical protein
MSDCEKDTDLRMSELAKLFSVGIENAMTEVGLLTEDGDPSDIAWTESFCVSEPTPCGDGIFFVWHRDMTVSILKDAGYVPVENEGE